MQINNNNVLKYLLAPWALSLCFVSVIVVIALGRGEVLMSVALLFTIALFCSFVYIIVLMLLISKGKISSWKQLQIAQLIGLLTLEILVLIFIEGLAPFLLLPLAYFVSGLIFQWWFWLMRKT